MTVVSTQSHTPTAGRRVKSSAAFRTISEVAGELELPPHVLRFWESKFTQVRPLKRGGGRRYYRPEDVDLLRRIRELLYTEGYTIKGVQKLLREGRGKLPENDRVAPPAPSTVREVTAQGGNAELRRELRSAIEELKSLRDILDGK